MILQEALPPILSAPLAAPEAMIEPASLNQNDQYEITTRNSDKNETYQNAW